MDVIDQVERGSLVDLPPANQSDPPRIQKAQRQDALAALFWALIIGAGLSPIGIAFWLILVYH